MLLRSTYPKMAILMVTCLLPSFSLAQRTKDGKVGGNLQVTEIRRVMKDGEVNAKNHHTKVVMTGVGEFIGTVNCTLILTEGGSLVQYYTAVTYLETEVIFEKPLVDADFIELVIFDSKGFVDQWTGNFIIKDLKSRVAVAGSSDNNSYLRVTTGEYLDTVSVDDAHECRNEDSPCYYRQKNLTISDLSMIERCTNLSSTDSKQENDTLLHCDDTYSDFIAISENTEPTRLLLEDTLHLIYMLPSVASEVVMVNPVTGDLIPNDPKGFHCTNNEEGCSIDLKIEGQQNINFIIVYEDDDYVDASMTYSFEIFEVTAMQLTNDAVMTTWSPSASGTFDVLITTREDLVKPNYYRNCECDVSDAKNGVKCETFFVIVYEEGKEYFAIIRPEENNGTNAIGKSIAKELKVTDISLEDDQIKVTVAADSSQVRMEVIIYDPKDSNNIISTGETDCDSEVEDNEEIMTCTQALNIPSDRTPVKVLVSEINDGGIVLKSSLSDFSFPDDSRPINTGTDTWIIVLSALASVLGTTFIVSIIVFVVKKKSQKSKDNLIEKKLNVSFRAKQHDTPQHTLPRSPHRVRFYPQPKESHYHFKRSDDPHDGPLYTIPRAHREGFFDDSYLYLQPKKWSRYSKRSDAPQAASRKDHSPYSRNFDFPRNVDSRHSKHYDSPHSSGYDNMTVLFPPRAEDVVV